MLRWAWMTTLPFSGPLPRPLFEDRISTSHGRERLNRLTISGVVRPPFCEQFLAVNLVPFHTARLVPLAHRRIGGVPPRRSAD